MRLAIESGRCTQFPENLALFPANVQDVGTCYIKGVSGLHYLCQTIGGEPE